MYILGNHEGGDSMDNKNENQCRCGCRYRPAALGVIIGGLCGFLFYRFVGCPAGTCPISSNPTLSTIFGGVIGLLIGSNFIKKDKKCDRSDKDE
jgi:hypothetical protein